MRLAARSALALAVVLLLATCSNPTEPPTPPGDDPPPVPPGGGPLPPMTELELTLSDSVMVHGYVLLRATGRAANGAVVAPPYAILYSTSDAAIATISSQGVVFGENRGTVTITASSGSVQASLTFTVRGRVAVTHAAGLALPQYLIAVGDTLPLVATFVDIDGLPIQGEVGAAAWSSSNPDALSVDQQGRVIAHQPEQAAFLTATTADEGSATTTVAVGATQAGLPATVRFAHAAPERGPLTFRPSRGEPVTLSAGQSVDVAVGSGFFYVTLDGLTGQQPILPWPTMIPPDGNLSLYAVGGTNLYLSPMWGPNEVVADSGMVRLVQGSSYLVVYLRSSGAPMDGLPEQCYFDPSFYTQYYVRPPGPFDILLQAKYQASDSVRLAASAPVGRPVTLVLTGNSAETAGYLTFPD